MSFLVNIYSTRSLFLPNWEFLAHKSKYIFSIRIGKEHLIKIRLIISIEILMIRVPINLSIIMTGDRLSK